MGNYVGVPPQYQVDITAIPDEPFEGHFTPTLVVPYIDAKDLVVDRFTQSKEYADQFITSLNGYLGDLGSVVQEFNLPELSLATITIPDMSLTIPEPPTMSGSITTSFPTFSTPAPTYTNVPEIDFSGVLPVELPDNLMDAISWTETAYDSPVYEALLARILSDLQSGASGVGGTVEQEIYDRAIARQAVDNDNKYREIEEYASSRGFELPTGAMMGRLQEQANVIASNNLDINGKIMIEQADLAQKNNQFIINASRELESVLRDFHVKAEDRRLDKAKAVAANAIAIYAQGVQTYIAASEVNKTNIMTQVENIKAIIDSNKGLVELYKAEVEVNGINVTAIAKANEAITEVYKADIQGYDAETKALTENQKGNVSAYSLQIQNADFSLRSAIANLDASVKGYEAEYGIREKVAEAMANIAMQATSSAFGCVNASAGISFNGGQSLSESFGHSESRSSGFSKSESRGITETNSYGHDESIKEEHNYSE